MATRCTATDGRLWPAWSAAGELLQCHKTLMATLHMMSSQSALQTRKVQFADSEAEVH